MPGKPKKKWAFTPEVPDIVPPELIPGGTNVPEPAAPPPPKPVAQKVAISKWEAAELRKLILEREQRNTEGLTLYQPLPIQAAFHSSNAMNRIVVGSNRAGKEQPIDEPVLTPTGWRPIGALQIGDKVIAGDGTATEVIGVFPQGQQPVFKVTFDDGAWTRCGEQHLWSVKLGKERFGDRRLVNDWQTKTLAEIRAFGGDHPVALKRAAIPVCVAQFDKRPLPLDPYLLGMLLGDGTFRHHIGFSKRDEEMIDSVHQLLPKGCSLIRKDQGLFKFDYKIVGDERHRGHYHNPVLNIIRDLGLWMKGSHEKFVPHDYLWSDAADRLAMLQGLLDTDGTCDLRSKRGQIEYSSSSPHLAEQVAFLVRSLGGKARTSWRIPWYTYKGERRQGKLNARIHINVPDINPFRLPRKAQGWRTEPRNAPYRILTGIESDGIAECVCIAVAHPSQTYVTRDFIVTHNTLLTSVEVARAVTNQDPFGKYPAVGRCFIVGKSWDHNGKVLWRKLAKAESFRVICDPVTNQWRPYYQWLEPHLKHLVKWAPPLIPPRLIKKIAWENSAKGIPKEIRLHSGWEISFYSGESDPPQGSDVDLIHFDEEIEREEWWPEAQARLLDRKGKFIWSATPQAGTDILLALYEQALRERNDPKPSVEAFRLSLKDNPHIDEEVKANFAKAISEDDRLVRVEGEFAVNRLRVFPEFRESIHCVEPFPIPQHWTRYYSIDPGYQVCAVLFAAVPPRDGTEEGEGDFVYLYDELYIRDCSADLFGQRMKARCEGQDFQAAVMDKHGGAISDIGSGKRIDAQYKEALAKHGVRTHATGHGFLEGFDEPEAGVELIRAWLQMRDASVIPDGKPKLRVFAARCPRFMDEVKHYRYQKIKNNITNKPETRGEVHLMAALRYLAGMKPRFVRRVRPSGDGSAVLRALEAKRKRQRERGGGDMIHLGPASSERK